MGSTNSIQNQQNTKELLLYGYVRNIENILNKEIPCSIYTICLEYYNNYIKALERVIFGVLFGQTNKLELITKLKHDVTKLTRVIEYDTADETTFLIALGYVCDESNNLVLKHNPTQQIIKNTLYVLNKYENTFDNINKYTLKELILFAIENNDNYIIWSILLTYSVFTDSHTLLSTLTAIIATNEKHKIAIVNIVKYWMHEYWQEDFYKNNEIKKKLVTNWFGYNIIKTQYEKLEKLPIEQSNHDFPKLVPKKYNLSKISVKDMATQITLLNYSVFDKIRCRECIKENWKSPNSKKLSPNVLEFIQQFNNLTIFIQIQILRERTLKARAKSIRNIIQIGEILKEWKNFHGLCALFSAMNSASIHRLKCAWRKVSEKEINKFKQWENIFARDNNHANLRRLVNSLDNKPCMPHIGIFLQDLILLEEGKDINNLKYESYNFHKCIDVAQRIKCLHSFQNNPYSELREDRVLQTVLLTEFDQLKDVTEDQIWDMSTEIKRSDQREDE